MGLRQAWGAVVCVWEGLVEVLTHLLSPTCPTPRLLVFSTHHQAPSPAQAGIWVQAGKQGCPCGAALPSLPPSSLPLWRRQLTAA